MYVGGGQVVAYALVFPKEVIRWAVFLSLRRALAVTLVLFVLSFAFFAHEYVLPNVAAYPISLRNSLRYCGFCSWRRDSCRFSYGVNFLAGCSNVRRCSFVEFSGAYRLCCVE